MKNGSEQHMIVNLQLSLKKVNIMKPNSQSSIFQVGEVASRGYRNKK